MLSNTTDLNYRPRQPPRGLGCCEVNMNASVETQQHLICLAGFLSDYNDQMI